MGVGIVAAINRVDIVLVVAVSWGKALEEGFHVLKQAILFFVDINKSSGMLADDRYLAGIERC